jgi:hypothetical protein
MYLYQIKAILLDLHSKHQVKVSLAMAYALSPSYRDLQLQVGVREISFRNPKLLPSMICHELKMFRPGGSKVINKAQLLNKTQAFNSFNNSTRDLSSSNSLLKTFPRPLKTFPRPLKTFPRRLKTFPRRLKTFSRQLKTFPRLLKISFSK